MAIRTEDTIRERGGIPLRDYTQTAGPLSLRNRLGIGTDPADRTRQKGRSILQRVNFDSVARFLGWASLGLGLVELIAPKRIQKMFKLRGDHSTIIRALGARELLHGLAIFLQGRPTTGVWSRVAGDAIDLGLLGKASTMKKANKQAIGIAAASVLGLTAMDVLTATQLNRRNADEKAISDITREDLNTRLPGGSFRVTRSLTIERSPEELYRFWRDFENLPRFMFHLQSVQVFDDRRSHWVTSGPAGSQVQWDAEIIDDQPNRRISWQSLPGASVSNSGRVIFEPAPGGRGTVVRAEIEYRPPAGRIGKLVAGLFGEEPGQQIAGDLHRFKQVVETGEVLLSDGTMKGFGQKMQRPARPASVQEQMKMKM